MSVSLMKSEEVSTVRDRARRGFVTFHDGTVSCSVLAAVGTIELNAWSGRDPLVYQPNLRSARHNGRLLRSVTR